MADLKSVGVVGAGTMGNGIAQVFAQSGIAVTLVDLKTELLDRALGTIEKNLRRVAKKKELDGDAFSKECLDRIKPSIQLEEVAEADIVVEAVVEDAAVKESAFRQLDPLVKEGGILASNTSSISITRLAAVTETPERVIGMHFMNPVPVMKLVEIVRGLETSDETLARTMAACETVGKTAIEVADSPGFVSNRVLMPMINEAIYCLQESVGTPEAIEGVMKLGMAHPMGPLALADLIGNDICLDILNVLHDGFGDPKYRPCPLLKKYVAAGRLGRKSGRGWYDYTRK
jgi:3-hydroxybutyryl-CoA dehydrogenase